MRIKSEIALDYSDVLIEPKRSFIESRNDVCLKRDFETRYGNRISGIPIIAANMATGNFKMLEALSKHEMFTAIAKHHNHEEWLPSFGLKGEEISNYWKDKLMYGFYTLGIKNEQEYEDLLSILNNLKTLNNGLERGLKIIIDVANGYMQRVSNFVKKLRDAAPSNVIFAGNVCTPEMTEELIMAGADGVKVGIGPGEFCTTRKVTGVGVPQLTAVINCVDAAHGLKGLVIADGGCRNYGDICKAFCANADFVMIGTMFAGTDECEGTVISKFVNENYEYERIDQGTFYQYKQIYKEKKYKIFYGMSSDYSRRIVGDIIENYRASEGLVEEVECKGPVDIQVRNILGGLRSCGSYIGAKNLKDFPKCTTFNKVNKIHSRGY